MHTKSFESKKKLLRKAKNETTRQTNDSSAIFLLCLIPLPLLVPSDNNNGKTTKCNPVSNNMRRCFASLDWNSLFTLISTKICLLLLLLPSKAQEYKKITINKVIYLFCTLNHQLVTTTRNIVELESKYSACGVMGCEVM